MKIPWMRLFRLAIIVAGLLAIAVVLWKLDAREVFSIIAHAGWKLLLLLLLEPVWLVLNALGWRLSFPAREAKSYGLPELARLWLAMEGINYLVPTGTVAGEVARASMLNDSQPVEVRTTSVVVSRILPTVAQIACALLGFVFLVAPRVHAQRWMLITATSMLVALIIVTIVYLVFGSRWIARLAQQPATSSRGWLRAMPDRLRQYFGLHPWRVAGAVSVFSLAYAWPSFEAYWICRFIGVPVSVTTALMIESLSIAIDGTLFFVPAKIGTQELGKTAIFKLLGLPIRAGFAFGVIRHLRELFWAVAGLTIYSVSRRRSFGALHPSGVPPPQDDT